MYYEAFCLKYIREEESLCVINVAETSAVAAVRTVSLYCGWVRRLAEDVAIDRAGAVATTPVR